MTPTTARFLGPVVKGKHFAALKDYANERIQWHHKQMEDEKDVEKIRAYQGAIRELKRILTLDVEAEQIAKGSDE